MDGSQAHHGAVRGGHPTHPPTTTTPAPNTSPPPSGLRRSMARTTHTHSALRPEGSTRRWRTIRDQVLQRDQHTCGYCGAHATHVDHITPRQHGGGDEPANLVAACRRCNLRKGPKLPQGGQFDHDAGAWDSAQCPVSLPDAGSPRVTSRVW